MPGWQVKKLLLWNTIVRNVFMFGLLKPVSEGSRSIPFFMIRKKEWRLADAFENFVNKAMIIVYKVR